jgi:hypothetical protein
MANFSSLALSSHSDNVFNVGNRQHARYYTEKLPWYVNKHVLRKDVPAYAPLYHFADPMEGEGEERRVSVMEEETVKY